MSATPLANWSLSLVLGLSLLIPAGCSRPTAPAEPAAVAPSGPEALYLAAADPRALWVGPPADKEAAALTAGAPAMRKGEALTLTFFKGPPVTLTSNEAACQAEDVARCITYYLLYDLPSQGVMLVAQYEHGGNAVLMYDRVTGRSFALDDLPKFSPDGRRLFVRALEYGTDDRGDLQIWRRDGDQTTLEWSQAIPKVKVEYPPYPINATVDVASWKDNVIQLNLSSAAPERKWPGRISLDQGRWTLTQTPPG